MLYEISCNIGTRYNDIPLYIYLTYTLCIMAVILQTRCLQMDNCEPDLSFSKYVELDCFRWLYIYGHICDYLSRYAQLKEYILLQSEQPGDWHQMKTTGPREQDWSCDEVIKTPGFNTSGTSKPKPKHCELMNTSRSWWRHKTSIFRSFRFYLRKGGFKLILAINTLSIFCEIPIRWIQHLTGH